MSGAGSVQGAFAADLPARLALRHPLAAGLIVAFVTLAAMAGLTRLAFDDGMATAFVGDSQAWQLYEQNHARFTPAEDDIAVLFRAPEGFDEAMLESVREFVFDANLAVNVDSSVSIFSLRASPAVARDTPPVLPQEIAGHTDIANLLETVRAHPLGGDRLISADLTRTIVIVSLMPGQGGLEPARRTLGELDAAATRAVEGTGMAYAVAGLVPVRQIVLDGMLRDLIVLNAIGIAIGSLICLAALRSLSLALLTGFPATIALIWSLGAMGWLGLEINTVTNAVPVLILVLALADSLHITFELRRRRPLHDTMGEAVADATRRVAPACALTSFTTALAFAAILISDSELIRSLGWAGMLATLIALAAVLVCHPLGVLAAARLPVVSRAIARTQAPQSGALGTAALYGLALRRPAAVSAVSLTLLAAALALYSMARPAYTFLENIGPSNDALAVLREVENRLAPVSAIDIPVKIEGLGDEAMPVIRRTADAVAQALPDAKISSPADLAQWLGEPDATATDLLALLQRAAPAQQGRFFSPDGSFALVRAYVPDRGARQTVAMADKIDATLTGAGVPRIANEEAGVSAPTGLLVMSSQNSLRMIGHLGLTFTIAVIAAGVFVALWFRDLRYGLVALIPNILPIACVGAWLFLSGRGLQFSSSVALTIAFGIAVDDTIHVLTRLKLAAPPGRPFDPEAVRQVFTQLSPVLVTTTAVLSFGMLGGQFSAIPTIAYFCILCIVVFVLALAAVLAVLPALLVMAGRMSAPAKHAEGKVPS